jgi:signal recognition particle receptor subunit beta
MVQFNNTDKEMTLKVVYVGCALGGKTTSLERVHERVLKTQRSRLFSLNTANDRTLFFDLLPLNLGSINGYSVRLQLYTVPGQVQYAATRRAVLAGVDAVAVVVDSAPDRSQDNRDALRDLADHLKFHGLDIRGIPLVLQYNKRDLPGAAPVGVLDSMLNSRAWPTFESVATDGRGVVEAFLTLIQIAGDEMSLRHRLPADFGRRTRAALERLLTVQEPVARPVRVDAPTSALDLEPVAPGLAAPVLELDLPELQSNAEDGSDRCLARASFDAATPVTPDSLLRGALEAQQAMVELNTELDGARERLRQRAVQMAELGRLLRMAGGDTKLPQMLTESLRTLGRCLDASAVAMLLPDPMTNGLREMAIHGAVEDPLNHAPCAGAPSVAAALFRQGKSSVGPAEGPPNSVDRYLTRCGYTSHMVVPLDTQGLKLGMLSAYRKEPSPRFDVGDRALFSTAAALVSILLETTRLRNLVASLQSPREPLYQNVG